ncbi:Ig domain-containing protein [Haloimpatiens sp. FM7330]|uniref:Ig-like domain-containing protein n=1 Tax=Haloimpatiens sp. FM7330 TaxID=3298610 RepID=UPI0036293D8B
MKKVWKIFMSLMLTIMMTTTAFAEVNVNVKNENGNITVSGTSDHKSQNVMIETWNQDKKYYIDADKTDENGNFQFEFKTASNINYNGRVKVGGESKDFNFSTGAFIGVQEIKLNKTSIKLKEGQAETLTATIIPENATNKKIVWISTNPKIASVDDNGKVTSKSKGKVIIQAISVSERKKVSCNVEVIKSDGETDPSKSDEEKQKEERKRRKK